jgi:hypothetical protein
VAGELVVAGREADGELRRGPPVDLGRASCARAAAVVETLVVDFEEALGGEWVEMVGGDAAP